MKFGIDLMRLLACVAVLVTIADARTSCAAEESEQSSIRRVAGMPNCPEPYAMREWSQVTRDYIDFLFDFERDGDHLPLVHWSDVSHTMVSMPAYIGGPRGPEAINYLAAVVSGSLVGIDMQNVRGHDWVAMGTNFFSEKEGVYVNRLGASTGKSFWYDIFPNVLIYQVNALYPNDAARDAQALSVALKWYEACVALGGNTDPQALPNFDHTGLRLANMQPTEKGWIEPEAAAGIAWLEYMAWVRHKDPRFLTAADWAVRSLEERQAGKSPLYEVLLPYGALTAARMNAETGSHYDVGKLVNECFEPSGRRQARPGWGVISDRWQGLDVHGLVGSTTDGGGYAFAMNSFQWLGALVPIARYDTRYAHDIGKWSLNLANGARLFYRDAHDAEHQSSFAWSAAHDTKSAIAYEGIRKWKRGAATARADYSTSQGRIVQGNFTSTHARHELPLEAEVLEELPGGDAPFEHIWEFDLPIAARRWLVVDAERIDGGHLGNAFEFLYSSAPQGPYTPAFSVSGVGVVQVLELPKSLQKKLYVKVRSSDRVAAWGGQDQLAVDAMAISYCSAVGPFAQGDQLVTFIDLLDEATEPIVLYRPATATTDLGLYGSSHVGILGGIVKRTNVEGILQLDLLKTDYFHAAAYPTFLYYNPHEAARSVEIALGSEATTVYDAVTNRVLEQNVRGTAHVEIPADSARVIVLAPANEKLRREGGRTLIGDVVVRYAD